MSWSKLEEDNLIQMWEKCSKEEILKIINRPWNGIQHKASRLRLKRKYEYDLRKYSINDNYFNKINNEHNAYWLGFLYDDGCVLDSDGRYRLAVLISNKDIEHLEKFKKDISSEFPILYAGKNRVRMVCASNKLCKDLIKLGCTPRKTFTIEFPKIQQDMIRHFVRGFFDGDGSVFVTNAGEWVCEFLGTEKFLQSLIKILNDIGINKKIYKQDNIYCLKISKQKDFYAIFSWMYKNSTIYLNRKYNKFLERNRCHLQ